MESIERKKKEIIKESNEESKNGIRDSIKTWLNKILICLGS